MLHEPPADEVELVRQAARGHAPAFAALTRRYYRPVASFLLKRVSQADLVEDLTQETFLQAYRSLRAGRVPERFSSWVFGIAHNCWGKWARRKQGLSFAAVPAEEVAAPESPPTLDEIEEQAHIQEKLRRCLAELPEETRRMLQMKHQQDRTCEEIAQEMGRPVGTIKSLLARTYKALRSRLGGEGHDAP